MSSSSTTTGRTCLALDPPLATVVIGDGRRRNALTSTDWWSIAQVLSSLRARDDLCAVVIRGRGAFFTAGSDITEWQDADPGAVDQSFAAMETALAAVEELDVPTIAVVEGVAAGAGCQLALACDIRIAADSALIGMPVLRWGILPSPSFVARIAQHIGPARAREWILRGTLLDAETARSQGIWSEVAPEGGLDTMLAKVVGELSAVPRSGLVATKRAGRMASGAPAETLPVDGWHYCDPSEMVGRIAGFGR